MKKVIAGFGMAATALVSAGIAAPGASATPTQHMYAHGTARMTHFTSWATCEAFAAASVRNLPAHGGKLVSGLAARSKCFPVANGTWSYLTVYTAARPVAKGDLTETAMRSDRGDWFWSYSHDESGLATVFTQAKCQAAMNAFTSRVIAGKNIRLLPTYGCSTGGHVQRHFSASYLGTSGSVGLKGDHNDGMWQHQSITSEAAMLGYSV